MLDQLPAKKEAGLYLPGDIIQHVDLCQNADRATVIHNDQGITSCEGRHGFFESRLGREDRACILHQVIDGFIVAVFVLFEHVIEQINFLDQADQFTVPANHGHLRNTMLMHHCYHFADRIAERGGV